MLKRLYIVLLLGIISISSASFAKEKAVKPVISSDTKTIECTNALNVRPLDVVANPLQFLNKEIVMSAAFDKFSTLGLDYKPALRENAKYIGFLIQRDDVTDHDVPLSEMKIFLKREYAEKFIDLETGDKIQIKGKVFSAALGDPWVDANEITVIKKAKAKEKPAEKAAE